MNYSEEYTGYSREILLQKIQMRMSEHRFKHVLGVEEMAIALAEKYGCSPEKASIAALTHDYAKERPAAKMSLLDKIIYVADYIEPGRVFPGVKEARELALIDLDEAVAFETKHTLAHLIEQEQQIYPKTIETYNRWVAQK